MSTQIDSLVEVYSTPIALDAEMVKSMLADEGITGFVENANAPFPGLTTVPCQVLVAAADVIHARQLVEEHEARRKQHANNAELETEAEEPDVL